MISEQRAPRHQHAKRLAVAGSVVSARSSILERRLRSERRILVAVGLLGAAVALTLWWLAR